MAVLAAATACVLMMSCAAPAYANTEKGWNTGGTYVQEEAGVDGSGTGDENSGSTEESSGLSENGSGTGRSDTAAFGFNKIGRSRRRYSVR